ncbi:MAG: type II secretion system protein, partial [Nitrospirae bacterium]|nr:type II secretion system protein [Nitrospirota bacterium]
MPGAVRKRVARSTLHEDLNVKRETCHVIREAGFTLIELLVVM